MPSYKASLTRFSALIDSLEQIPTIGKKSARKIAFTLATENKYLALQIAQCIENSIGAVRSCSICGALSENEICEICLDDSRDSTKLCVVLNARDIFTLEDIGYFDGKYWVLEGELEGVNFTAIKERVAKQGVQEIIFAFSPSLANEAVMIFIEDKLSEFSHIVFSKIAQGVPTGIGLENIDQLSLSRALSARVKL